MEKWTRQFFHSDILITVHRSIQPAALPIAFAPLRENDSLTVSVPSVPSACRAIVPLKCSGTTAGVIRGQIPFPIPSTLTESRQ